MDQGHEIDGRYADRIDELLSVREIEGVLKRVARGTDRHDAELIGSGYHPDGIDDHGGVVGMHGFKGTGADFADFAVTVMEGSTSQHLIGQISIDFQGDVAFSEMYAQCHLIVPASDGEQEKDFFHGVRYLDRFERRDAGPWLIAHRIVCWDWAFFLSAADKLTLTNASFVGGQRRHDPSYRIAELTVPEDRERLQWMRL